MEDNYTISFVGTSTAQGNQYAESLMRALRDTDPNLALERQRTRDDSQDFGASLALVLGTASVSAIAKGVARWIAKNGGAHIEIAANGTVIATNLQSGDAAKIAEAFSRHKK